MMIRLMTYIAIAIALIPFVLGGNPCNYTDSSKGTIDLSPLSAGGGKAKYPDEYPSGAHDWSMCL